MRSSEVCVTGDLSITIFHHWTVWIQSHCITIQGYHFIINNLLVDGLSFKLDTNGKSGQGMSVGLNLQA